jgi:hypothetical protein
MTAEREGMDVARRGARFDPHAGTPGDIDRALERHAVSAVQRPDSVAAGTRPTRERSGAPATAEAGLPRLRRYGAGF